MKFLINCMSISIQLYRASIGLHNNYRCKGNPSSRCRETGFTGFYDKLQGLAPAAGKCIKCVLVFVFILNFLLDSFQETFICKDHTTSPNAPYFESSSSILIFKPNKIDLTNNRLVFSCIIYCFMNIVPIFIHNVCTYGFKGYLNVLYLRLFHKNSSLGCFINLYSIWLFAMNLSLMVLSIPNLVNPGPTSDLNVLYQNVQGFVNIRAKSSSPTFFTSKVLDFQGYLFHEKPDVVILNETWLKESVQDSEIFPNNAYKVFRRDRSLKSHPCCNKVPTKFKTNGGGVVIAFRSDLDVTTTEFKLKDGPALAEIISVVVAAGSGSKLCISTLYRVGTLGAENLYEVRKHLQSIAESKSINRHILIGDFNLSKTSWPDGISSCSLESEFINLFDDLGLVQFINTSTHKSGNTLDLLLSSSDELVSNIEIIPKDTVCSSDHFGIKFKIKLKCKRSKSQKRKIYNLKKANFKAINRELLRVHRNSIFGICDSDEALDRFESIFTSICDKLIPKVTVKSSFQPPWFDSELDSICRAKNKLLDRYKATNNTKFLEEAKGMRKKFKKLCTQKKMSNVMNSDDPALVKKKFWSYYKSTSNSCRVPETVHYKSRFRSAKADVANLFNNFFSDQFSSPSDYNININFDSDPLSDIKFCEKTVFDLLRKLDSNKAAGPDGRQAKLLKCCASGLAGPLSMLYTKIFRSGSIPKLWKLGNVVPVHKKGDKSSVENYRPISLTCLSMKVFEYCIKDILMKKCGPLIDDSQHGFLPNKSCTTQMIPFSNNLALALNNLSRTDVIYFDFAKAFDSVNHDIILQKLKCQFGIDGLLLQFIKSYLQDRKQKVVVGGVSSGTLPVQSGVPQGSILGPLLFVIFINDMQSVISPGTSIALYADDTKIWREIISEHDQVCLQNDINNLYKWSVDNMMKFHPDKCKVLAVTNKRLTYELPFYEYFYSLNDALLDYVESEKDLGVVINSKLNWNSHCIDLASKANQRLGFVRRTCHFILSSEQRRVLYLSLVRSIFEHCSPVWAPQTPVALNAIDLVQRRAVKWILKEPFTSYSDNEYLLKQGALDVLPIKSKFMFTDLVLFHRIVYGSVCIKLPYYVVKWEPKDVVKCTRNSKCIFDGSDKLKFRCTVRPKVKAFEYSFFVRSFKSWNDLPLALREVEDSAKFPAQLKEHLWLLLGLKPD